MFAIEFETQIKNGFIEVPAIYQRQISGAVRVIVLASERTQSTGMIARLLKQPIQDDAFIPLKRDEIYQERIQNLPLS
ncbi:MAG: hypothetical protein U0350_35850 [Caldilineaceae bacterium]